MTLWRIWSWSSPLNETRKGKRLWSQEIWWCWWVKWETNSSLKPGRSWSSERMARMHFIPVCNRLPSNVIGIYLLFKCNRNRPSLGSVTFPSVGPMVVVLSWDCGFPPTSVERAWERAVNAYGLLLSKTGAMPYCHWTLKILSVDSCKFYSKCFSFRS